jgi:hypothetical protein
VRGKDDVLVVALPCVIADDKQPQLQPVVLLERHA